MWSMWGNWTLVMAHMAKEQVLYIISFCPIYSDKE